MARRIKHFGGIKKGQKFKVVANSNGHNYPIDVVLKFKSNSPGPHTTWNSCAAGSDSFNTLSAVDVALIGQSISELELEYVELEEERDKHNSINNDETDRYNKETNAHLLEIKKQIKFCKDLGITEYDDNVEKMYKAIQIINEKKDMPDIEKARIISEMFTD